MIKVTKNEGIKTGIEENGKEQFAFNFLNFSEVEGREIVLTEKEIAYIKRANTQFLKGQAILEKAYKSEG